MATRRFGHVNDARRFIVERLSDPALLGRNGLNLRQAIYVLPYDPKQEESARDLIKAIIQTDLPANNVHAVDVNLYDIVLDYLDREGVWEPLTAAEPDCTRSEIIMMLQDAVSAKDVIAPAVNERMVSESDADLFFITGVGETFPYVRTHTVLQNLDTGRPVVLVFPGRFEQSNDGSTSLDILDIDQGTTGGFYRATNVFDL
ncbi:MAG: DUF1788 domain-containing protein [Atopobiaceae bacterium]